jgi:hypothetical protein
MEDRMATKVLICLLACFAATTNLKVADVQPAEVLSLVIAGLGTVVFILKGFRMRLSRVSAILSKHYLLFSLVLIVLVLVNLRQTFFVPASATSIMKQPFWISLSRFAQLTLIYMSFIFLLERFRESPRLLSLAVRTYLLAGTVSAVYSLFSYAALRGAGIDLGGAYDTWGLFRTRGFFVEGGPFGLYVLSVMTLKVFEGKIMERKLRILDYLQFGVLFLAFILSVSKSAVLAMVILIGLHQVVSRFNLKSLLMAAGALLVMVPILYQPIVSNLALYRSDYTNFAQTVLERPDDPNLVMGRIAASIIVPQMVLQRPLLGVGLGNYSLTRNDPNYSQGIPTVDEWDLPGLGFLGYLAELGIPLSLYLLYLLCRPLIFGIRSRAETYVLTLLGFQLVANFMGVQLTFIYPWIITAIALGVISRSQLQNAPDSCGI